MTIPAPPLADTSKLFGRERETAILTDLITGAHRGGGSLLLRGEPGVGKSCLLREAARLARLRGHLVLTATGIEGDVEPYLGLRQMLPEDMVAAVDLPTAQRVALRAATSTDDPTVGVPEPYLVGMAALSVITDAPEERPITLIVDDAHWLDPQSRSVIAFLGRRLASDPVVLIVASRPVDVPEDEVEATTTITVPPLTAEAAQALLDDVGPHLDSSGRDQILLMARGNPLALTELPRTWEGATPANAGGASAPVGDHIRSSFAGSYRRLPAASRDALLIAALDEHASIAEILLAVEGFSGQAGSTAALAPCIAAGLMQLSPSAIVFRHPLVRAAVVRSEDSSRVRSAHRALASVVVEIDPRRALIHRARAAHDADDALASELEREAHEGRERAETTAAIWFMEQAARVTSDPAEEGPRLLTAATWAFELGDRRSVDRLLAAAATDHLGTLDKIRASWLADIFDAQGSDDTDRILDLHRDVQVAWRAGDLDLAWNILMSIASRCYWAKPDETIRSMLASTALAMPTGGAEHRLVFVLSGIDQVSHTTRILAECHLALTRNVSDANALRMFAMGAVVVGDAPVARIFVDEAERLLRAQGRLGLLPHVLLTRAQADHLVGHWDRARTALAEGQRLAEETHQPIWINSSRLAEARHSALTGELEDLEEALARIERGALEQGTLSFLPRVQVVRSTALVANGAYQEGLDLLVQIFDRSDPMYDARNTFPAIMFLADAAVATDHRPVARRLVEDVHDALGSQPPVDFRVVQAYADAVLADDGDAEDRFQQALNGEAQSWPWVLARLRLAYGGWLHRQRRDAEATPLLQMALTELSRMGAVPWVEKARAQLRASGNQAPTDGVLPQQVLNAQELQIATLAASGLSNREIGEQLFLSPRTVGSSLYRIFPKLGIASRRQLATMLAPAE